ncbi:MAG: PadR family transcriptional regulator [Gammaproteobacteria bacterium]|nr:MAG: PadR family transcriptional regulator [Gammaproteobacteria bacterium]
MSLRYAILVDLCRGEGTGYEIAKRFQEGVGFSWKASHPQIYSELKKMADMGWVEFEKIEQESKPAKKIYRLTDDGLNSLKLWMDTPAEIPPVRDMFIIKMTVGDLATPSKLLREVLERKKFTMEKMAIFQQIEETHYKNDNQDPKYKFPQLSLRAAIITFEAHLKWFDELIEYLETLVKSES